MDISGTDGTSPRKSPHDWRNLEVDFTGFEAIIDRVGGIDIELTSAETAYINNRNHTSIVAGLNHLNGAEALT